MFSPELSHDFQLISHSPWGFRLQEDEVPWKSGDHGGRYGFDKNWRFAWFKTVFYCFEMRIFGLLVLHCLIVLMWVRIYIYIEIDR